jgi:hypothetical protein
MMVGHRVNFRLVSKGALVFVVGAVLRLAGDQNAARTRRRSDATAGIAADLPGRAHTAATGLARGVLGRANLLGTARPQFHTLLTARVATILPGATGDPVARLLTTDRLGAAHLGRKTEPATQGTTLPAMCTADQRTRVRIGTHTDPGAIRPTLAGVALVTWIVDADESARTRDAGDPAAASPLTPAFASLRRVARHVRHSPGGDQESAQHPGRAPARPDMRQAGEPALLGHHAHPR